MTDSSVPPPLPTVEPAGPLPASGRIETVDILRGIALLGILLVNMAFFATPIYSIVTDYQWGEGALDRAVESGIVFFAQGKFYVLFSFLFGWGLAMQTMRGAARGIAVAPLFRRRLFILLGIGLIHAFLIWHGDILVVYAAVGFLLLAFRTRRDRTLLVWAGILVLLPILWNAVLVGFIEVGRIVGGAKAIAQSFAAAEADYVAAVERSLEVFAHGSFGEILVERSKEYWFALSGGFLFGGIFMHILAMFLLGLWVGRRGYLSDPARHLPLFRRGLVVGLVIGLPANALVVAGHEAWATIEPTFVSVGVLAGLLVGGPALALAYVSGIVLLLQRPTWRGGLHGIFAPVGRTALSNYLFQSLVATFIFYSYGLGFFGRGGPAVGLALALGIFTVQVALSRWWLRRFRFGPMEWLWRSLTYGRKQPLRAE